MVVKVYGANYAACPQRVMTCLFELGIQFDLIKVDLQSGEQKLPQNLLRQVIILFMNVFIFSIISKC